MPASRWKVNTEQIVRAEDLKMISLMEKQSRFVKTTSKLKVEQDKQYQDTFHIFIKKTKGIVNHPETYRHSIIVLGASNDCRPFSYKVVEDDPSNRIDYIAKNFKDNRFFEVDSCQLRQFKAKKIIDVLEIDLEGFGIGIVQQIEKVNYLDEDKVRYIIKTKFDTIDVIGGENNGSSN